MTAFSFDFLLRFFLYNGKYPLYYSVQDSLSKNNEKRCIFCLQGLSCRAIKRHRHKQRRQTNVQN